MANRATVRRITELRNESNDRVDQDDSGGDESNSQDPIGAEVYEMFVVDCQKETEHRLRTCGCYQSKPLQDVHKEEEPPTPGTEYKLLRNLLGEKDPHTTKKPHSIGCVKEPSTLKERGIARTDKLRLMSDTERGLVKIDLYRLEQDAIR